MTSFWVVWTPTAGDTGPAKRTYPTLGEAELEATRLSQAELKPVYVLEAVAVFSSTVNGIVTTVDRPVRV